MRSLTVGFLSLTDLNCERGPVSLNSYAACAPGAEITKNRATTAALIVGQQRAMTARIFLDRAIDIKEDSYGRIFTWQC